MCFNIFVKYPRESKGMNTCWTFPKTKTKKIVAHFEANITGTSHCCFNSDHIFVESSRQNIPIELNWAFLRTDDTYFHEIETRNHDRLHLYQTSTSGARNVLRHHIPELLNKSPLHLVDRFKTHSLYSISHHIICYLIDLYSYDCDEIDCYICNHNWERKIGDSVTWVLWQPFDHWLWPRSTASIDMGWFDVTVFPYRSCTEAIIFRFSSLAALEVVKMITSSTAGDGSFVAATTFSFQWIATELLLRAFT